MPSLSLCLAEGICLLTVKNFKLQKFDLPEIGSAVQLAYEQPRME